MNLSTLIWLFLDLPINNYPRQPQNRLKINPSRISLSFITILLDCPKIYRSISSHILLVLQLSKISQKCCCFFFVLFFAEANVMYVPWDPPLVLHVADLLKVSIAGCRPGSYLGQGYYWHQWGSNPRSRDHEFYALTTRPRIPVPVPVKNVCN